MGTLYETGMGKNGQKRRLLINKSLYVGNNRRLTYTKFGKQQRAKVIDGCYDEKSIADDFAKMFSEVCDCVYLTHMKDTVSFGLILMTSSALIHRPA